MKVKIKNLLQCKQSQLLKEESLGSEFDEVLKFQKEWRNFNI